MIELFDETDYDGGPVAAVPGTATWDWDVVTDRMRLSPGLLDMLGLPQHLDVDRRRVATLMHPDDSRMLYRTLHDAGRTGGSCRRVVRMVRADGSGPRTFDVYGEGRRDTATGPARRLVGTIRVGVSAGVAEVVHDDVDASLGNASLALAEAKRTGRKRAVPFTAELSRAANRRAALLRRVVTALDDDTMALDAQPIVDLRSGRVTRYELLIRLRDGRAPPVGPAEFLPVVESTELIYRLDRWVVGRAVRALATPRGRALGLRLEANISGRSLEDPDFGPWVLAELRRHGVEPARLGVEVTETAAVTELAAARSLATVLIDSGVGFALDDFGAGFGSFAYLKHLRFTSVKIAGDFVAHVDHEQVDRALVSAVVVVARQLGLVTVAEKVDRPELVDDLRRLGVDHGQGYHLGRPVPLDGLIGVGAAPGRTG